MRGLRFIAFLTIVTAVSIASNIARSEDSGSAEGPPTHKALDAIVKDEATNFFTEGFANKVAVTDVIVGKEMRTAFGSYWPAKATVTLYCKNGKNTTHKEILYHLTEDGFGGYEAMRPSSPGFIGTPGFYDVCR